MNEEPIKDIVVDLLKLVKKDLMAHPKSSIPKKDIEKHFDDLILFYKDEKIIKFVKKLK